MRASPFLSFSLENLRRFSNDDLGEPAARLLLYARKTGRLLQLPSASFSFSQEKTSLFSLPYRRPCVFARLSYENRVSPAFRRSPSSFREISSSFRRLSEQNAFRFVDVSGEPLVRLLLRARKAGGRIRDTSRMFPERLRNVVRILSKASLFRSFSDFHMGIGFRRLPVGRRPCRNFFRTQALLASNLLRSCFKFAS